MADQGFLQLHNTETKENNGSPWRSGEEHVLSAYLGTQ
jgi:hypothetical protein